MKTWYLLPLALVFIVLMVALVERPPALQSVVEIAAATVSANKHHGVMLRCGRIAMQASHNHAVIARAAEYVGAVGSSTGVFMGIASAAAALDEECPDLERVLDLSIMTKSNGPTILALARSACRAETPEVAQRWEDVLAEVWATAEYPDPETALAARRD